MTKIITSVIMGSGAFFSWQAVDQTSLAMPVRMWALLVFVFQVGTLVAVWLKK